MKIDTNAYNAIMLNAVRAYDREGWLIDAIEDIETATEQPATGEAIASHIEEIFTPYCDKLMEKVSGVQQGDEEKARKVFFLRFSNLVNS